MEMQHIIVKIPVSGELAVDPALFIDIFHRWVAEQSMDELLIDVADLRHVPAGPGVILVGLQADYGMDHTADRWGLLYRRKDIVAGSNADRMGQAVSAATRACGRLEQELDGRLAFSRTTFDVIVNDRALAPNTAATRATVEPELRTFITTVFGHDEFTLVPHDGDPRRRFGMTVESSRPFDLGSTSAS